MRTIEVDPANTCLVDPQRCLPFDCFEEVAIDAPID